MFSEPTALMTNRAARTSVVPSGFRMPTCQRLVGSSHVRDVTAVLKRQCGGELVLVEHADEVIAQLGLLAEVLGPMMRRLERVAVVMTSDVDPCARVLVLPPGTTRALVLLDDHEGKAGLRQADPREDAGQATADHDDRRRSLRLVRHLVAPGDRATVGAVELHVLEEHRHHDPLEWLAREERHHLDEDVSGELVRDAPAVPVGGDGRHRASTDAGKLLVVETALQVCGVRHAPERPFADP